MGMWKDPNKGLRKHSLLTQAEQKKLPPLYSTDGKGDKATAQVKLFSPWSNWEWYLTEFDPDTGMGFGLIKGQEEELGYIDLNELAAVKVYGSTPAVERDKYWKPRTLGQVRSGTEPTPAAMAQVRATANRIRARRASTARSPRSRRL